MATPAPRYPTEALINGKWVKGAASFPVTDPATGKIIANVPDLELRRPRLPSTRRSAPFPHGPAKTAKERGAIA